MTDFLINEKYVLILSKKLITNNGVMCIYEIIVKDLDYMLHPKYSSTLTGIQM